MFARFKDLPPDAPIADSAGDVEIPPEVDDALIALYEQLGSDWDAVIAKLATPASPLEVEQKWAGMGSPPALVDQKKKKAFDPATDPLAVAVGSDQSRRKR